jgi:hypothetical protein
MGSSLAQAVRTDEETAVCAESRRPSYTVGSTLEAVCPSLAVSCAQPDANRPMPKAATSADTLDRIIFSSLSSALLEQPPMAFHRRLVELRACHSTDALF